MIRKADAALEDPGFSRWRHYDTVYRHYRATIRLVQGQLEEETGNYADAERSFRASLADVRWSKENERSIRNLETNLRLQGDEPSGKGPWRPLSSI